MQTVQLLRHKNWWPKETHPGSQWREAFRKQVHLLLHNSFSPRERLADPFVRGKSLSGVTSATTPALKFKIWKHTSSHTVEKNLLDVSSASILPSNPIIWSIICYRTLARNILPASNVTTPAKSQISWRCTWESTMQKRMHKIQAIFIWQISLLQKIIWFLAFAL